MSSGKRKRYSLNFSAPASPITPSIPEFNFDQNSSSGASNKPLQRPSSTQGLGLGRSQSQRTNATGSFYKVPNNDFRVTSFDSLTDSASIKLILIGDAAVGKTAMILSYCNELPTRAQLELVSSASKTNLRGNGNDKRIQQLKKIEKRKRYSLNDYDKLFNGPLDQELQLAQESVCEPKTERIDPNEIIIDTRTTIGVDIRTNLVNIDNRYFKVIMWDTAGQERYRNAMIPSLYKGSNGVLLSYDITSYDSFRNCCNYWFQEVLENCPHREKLRFYLVGNKIDLYQAREVTHEDVLAFVDKAETQLGVSIAGNFEVSCKWHQVVDKSFNIIIKDLIENGCYDDSECHPVEELNRIEEPPESNKGDEIEKRSISGGSSEGLSIGANASRLTRRKHTQKSETIDISKPFKQTDRRSNVGCCL
ncbi:LAMI_0G07272g1_1 [Lachancea mirantina]|uniref:LAMI_0G07272g1_1 n=1 Tax=Lachancea mirantina TaxID=1230905 RepID=A0A1G4K9J9_9SACH|nr:LAMI_0G07272g1_1 [Lachancea mirantina]